jgi:hypothetical protein
MIDVIFRIVFHFKSIIIEIKVIIYLRFYSYDKNSLCCQKSLLSAINLKILRRFTAPLLTFELYSTFIAAIGSASNDKGISEREKIVFFFGVFRILL